MKLRRLARLVPPLSAWQLGLFRIVFGTALLLVFIDAAVFLRDPIPRELHRGYSPLARIAWVHWLAASGPALTTGAFVTYLALAAFIVGIWTRVAYFVVAVGFLVHALVVLQRSGVHDLGVLAVTLLCLLVVPWGDGLSLDARFAQLYASATRIDVEPRLTWFPMYANTFRSTEAFDASREERFSRFSFRAGGMDITDWVDDVNAQDVLVAAATLQQSELSESQRSSLRFLEAQYEAAFGEASARVEIRLDRQAFDWTSGRFIQVERNALFGTVEFSDY